METSLRDTTDFKARSQEYLNSKNLNGMLVDMVEDLLMNEPENPAEFMMKYLMKKYPKETENIKKDLSLFAVENRDNDDEHSNSSNSSNEDEDEDDFKPIQTKRHKAVFAEKLCPIKHSESEIKIVPKTDEEATHIREILSENLWFDHLDETQIVAVQNAMFLITKEEGDVVIEQGDDSDNFYIIDDGIVEVFIESEKKSSSKDGQEDISTKQPKRKLVHGDLFGELAILHNAPRSATCIAKTAVKLWALDRVSFKSILMKTTIMKLNAHKEFLKKVPIFSHLTEYENMMAAEAFHEENFEDGDVICREGEKGGKFYLIEEGTVVCTVDKDGESKEVSRLTNGAYFGEMALVTPIRQQTTVTASGSLKCLTLCQKAFKRVLGPIQNILMRKTFIPNMK